LHIEKQREFINKKIVIFKKEEYSQIPNNTAIKKDFFSTKTLRTFNSYCGKIIYQRTSDY
jgi:hypothetical protein